MYAQFFGTFFIISQCSDKSKGRTRSNHAEAEAIVKEILNRLRIPEVPEKSIGVVSFSQVQQNLIEDMLIEELNKYPELEEKSFPK